MIKVITILLTLLYGFAMYKFSAWRTRQDLKAKSTLLKDAALTKALKPLAQSLDLPAIRVNVYEVEMVNGLAAPDGQIYLTRGFLDKLDKDEVTALELVSVVAHELGHVALGHTRRRMIDFSGQNALRTTLAMFLNRFLPGVGWMIANLVTSALAARMSRKDEFEADAYATALMMKSGYTAAPQKALFEKLEALSGSRGATPAWFLSHPKAADRIAAITANEDRWT